MKGIAVLALAAGLGWSLGAQAQDAAAAEALMKKGGSPPSKNGISGARR